MSPTAQDFLADEDMQVLVAISKALAARLTHYSINLPGGAMLTNINGSSMKMVGIDQIKSALDMLMKEAGDAKWCLVMPTNIGTTRQKIGEMFAIPLYIDPMIPKNDFLIQEDTRK